MLRRSVVARPSKKCNCPVSIAVLAAIGAEHAARMHGRSAAKGANEWSGRDWTLHIREEDDLFFPLTALIDPRATRALYEDHLVFLEEIARYGEIVSLERLRRHSEEEDRLARLLVERGLVEV